jgi:G3E family GTPase
MRQAIPRPASVPVTILTGFLGSGKTTLLNRLLRLPDLTDTAVIVNEFGEVGFDHLLIEQAFENTMLLKNGCICCTVRGDVADTLETLFARRRAGEIPQFRRIAIETTGLADPAPLAHTIVAEGAAYACRLDGIVTTVDAVHGAAQLARGAEARNQVAMADRLLLTMTDLASPAQTAATEAAIRQLNPGAPLQHAGGVVAPDSVFGLSPESAATPSGLMCWLAAPELPEITPRHDGISSTLITCDTTPTWPDLRRWLNSLLTTRGADVLRLKGLAAIKGAGRPLLLQAVHHVLHPPRWLNDPAIAPTTQIVLITRGLSPAGLRASFDMAMAPGFHAPR